MEIPSMIWADRQRSRIGGHPAIRAGAGKDILLLHGVGLRAEAWAAQVGALSAIASVTAPDMPGHGESILFATPPVIGTYTDAAAEVLNALNGPAFVVGHSMGAMNALDLAQRFPEQVRGVVALNAIFERTPDAASAVQTRAAALDGQTPADPGKTLDRWFDRTGSSERDACERWLKTVDPVAYKDAYTAFAHSTVPEHDLLARLQCPTLFITGSVEPNSTPEMSRAMAAIAPKGRAIIVEGAAHMMPMTHPTDVNTALFEFFQECME